ncbi:MAG: hypothetical protein QW068_04755 [Thermoplasmata archaeon]
MNFFNFRQFKNKESIKKKKIAASTNFTKIINPKITDFWAVRSKLIELLNNNNFYANLAFRVRQSFLSNDFSIKVNTQQAQQFINQNLINIRELIYYLERDGFALYDITNKSFIDIGTKSIKSIEKLPNGFYNIELEYKEKLSNIYIFSYTFADRFIKLQFDYTDLQNCVPLFETLEHIERNLLIITEILGRPIQVFRLTEGDRDNLSEILENGQYKLGDALLLDKDSSYDIKSIKVENVQILLDQKIGILKLLSANIGIPIFLLGYPELMSNRATAIEMLEQIRISTNQEVYSIKNALKDFYYLLLTNNKFLIDKNDLIINYRVETKYLIEEKMQTLFKLYELGTISLETLLSNVNSIDLNVENEIEKIGESL